MPPASRLRAPVAVDAESLTTALAEGHMLVRVKGRIELPHPLNLPCGRSLEGVDDTACLAFPADGIRLGGDNILARLGIEAPPACDAIALSNPAVDHGTVTLEDLECTGAVRLLIADGHGLFTLVVRNLHVAAADTVQRLPRPAGNGVEVQQGAFTVWNRGASEALVDIADLSVGAPDAPVRGCGVFVAGPVRLARLMTGPVHADSTLDAAVTGTVSGGVFLLGGVVAGLVESVGPVVTHGANCVPIDTWGDIGRWAIREHVQSHGPSAVGFVNAGKLELLELSAGIETFGEGARACCIYGPTGRIVAARIVTHGKAACGVQVAASLDALIISESIVTYGSAGEGLVKGRMLPAYADAVHVEPGGILGTIDCPAMEMHGGDALAIRNEGTIAFPLQTAETRP